MDELGIKTVGLAKDYRSGFWMTRYRALHPMDLEVRRGEAFGFVGPNGAGKTTTIKILAGLHPSTSGEAYILGSSVRDPSSREKLGFLPERPYFYTHLTAEELLHFYGQLFGLSKQKRTKRIGALLERTQMERFSKIPLGKYSKGMLQRIGLCQTLLHDPELVILDEPISGLDPVGRALVRDILQEERDRGKTIFFSSHVLNDVQAICDRVAIIVQGTLRGVGSVDELVGRKVRHVDCVFRLSGEPALPGPVRQLEGGLCSIRLRPEDVDASIDAVRAAGGSVIEIAPFRMSLEEVLVGEVMKDAVEPGRMGVLA